MSLPFLVYSGEKPGVTNANHHGANLSALLALPTVAPSLSFISSELSSGLPDIHRSFISFMTDSRDQVIQALQGLFKGLVQTHPFEPSSPPPPPPLLPSFLLLFFLFFSRILVCLDTHVCMSRYTRPHRVVRNFIPAIGVAYFSYECR